MLKHSNSLLLFVALSFVISIDVTNGQEAAGKPRWTKEKATEWYAELPWLVGCNFLPSTAINQLEMWQADTFDPETIDRELGWAAAIGCNTMRVFLHDICWQEDRDGFFQRIDQYLAIADKHKIRTMFVIFDGVWDPDPKAGLQREPKPGVHNSGWVQSPGRAILEDENRVAELQPYVADLLKKYGNDKRVLVWDVFNEPDNPNAGSYGSRELQNKDELAAKLVKLSFAWARQVDPEQPLTVGLWRGPAWDQTNELNLVHKAALDESDVISFHDYGDPNSMKSRIAQLKGLGRPLFCTEFMARGNGSTFEAILPILKEEKVAAYCWGLVDGKSQTKYPWTTWEKPISGEPSPWHHDIFHADGTPYAQQEVDTIKSMTQ
ncbi:MAG: cellulase family glycosylhydrolase [Bythopirellula sp.]|nr:cellulase family glycosylhydrolase [Bythopirellula sp.]